MINVFHGRTQVVRILRVPLRTLIIDHPQWHWGCVDQLMIVRILRVPLRTLIIDHPQRHWGCVDQLMLSHSYNYTYTQLYTHKVS